MPIYDFLCDQCGHTSEEYVHSYRKDKIQCHKCSGDAVKQFPLFRSAYKEDANWVKDVLEVVDKDSPKLHVRRFLETPNRKNWQLWMKGEGLRPLEDNERIRPGPFNREPLVKDIVQHLREWNKIVI